MLHFRLVSTVSNLNGKFYNSNNMCTLYMVVKALNERIHSNAPYFPFHLFCRRHDVLLDLALHLQTQRTTPHHTTTQRDVWWWYVECLRTPELEMFIKNKLISRCYKIEWHKFLNGTSWTFSFRSIPLNVNLYGPFSSVLLFLIFFSSTKSLAFEINVTNLKTLKIRISFLLLS